jgi:hypothetical protein
VPADEHCGELHGIEAIALGATLAAIDLDAGGIDDDVLDPFFDKVAMEPETVATGFIATEHGRVVRELEALLGTLDLESESVQATGRDGAQPRRLGQSGREGELPFARGQFDGHVERQCRARGRL